MPIIERGLAAETRATVNGCGVCGRPGRALSPAIMAQRYRVIFQKKTIWQAMIKGRAFTDWYIAQARGLLMWREIGVYPTREAAEAACHHHAGGVLVEGGGRIVSEFERPE